MTAATPADVPGQGEVEALDHEARMRGVSTSQFRLAVDFVDAILRDVFQGRKDHLRGQMLDVAAKVSRRHPWPYFEQQVAEQVEARLAERDAEVARAERERVLGEVERRLRAKAFEWKCEYERSDLEADYGRWDGWENAADIARHVRNEARP